MLFGSALNFAHRLFGDRSSADAERHASILETMPAWVEAQMQRERDARTAFALVPIGMLIGIVACYGLDLRLPLAVGLSAVAAVFVAGHVAEHRLRFLLHVLLLPVLIGSIAAERERATTDTTVLSGEATTRITGTVREREADARGRQRYVIVLEETQRPVLTRPPERVRVLVNSAHQPLAIGQRYVGLVRLRPPAGPSYPGAYDFAFGPYFEGLGAYGFSLGAPAADTEMRPLGWRDHLGVIRLSMDERIRTVIADGEGAVASALITGLRGAIPDEIEENFRVTGLAHVLSISGFHMALVAGFVMLAVRVALAALPIGVVPHIPTKKIAAVCALVVTTFYYLLAGDNAATERSFIMIAIMLGAVLLDRAAITLRNVGIAALIVMLSTPHVVLGATFQMSFAATVALVGVYGAWSRHRRDGGRGGEGPSMVVVVLVGLAASSIIAAVATAPFSIYHFQRAAPLGLFANLVAGPIFSFWIMPLGLASALAMPFGLDAPLLHLMGLGLSVVLWIADLSATWFPDVVVGRLGIGALWCFACALVLFSVSASAFRWFAVPLCVLGFALAAPPTTPEFVLYEDGRQAALIEDRRIFHLQKRPNDFVADQWVRAFRLREDGPLAIGFDCSSGICRARTSSGVRIAWTDDYERLDEACRETDIAIVARAIRQATCRSGARLVTLRTLRRSGSLALSVNAPGRWTLVPSIPTVPTEWNVHRHRPWPQSWRRQDPAGFAAATSNGTGGSDPPDGPAP